MMDAANRVHTASVTYAVRDTVFDNRDIREGDIMGLVDNKLSLVGEDVVQVARDLLDGMVVDETELITIYYGEEIPEESAQALCLEIQTKYDWCDVSVYSGTQPLYYYLIAVE
jgi:dihydroxyacetone kinase-like predicted kinase